MEGRHRGHSRDADKPRSRSRGATDDHVVVVSRSVQERRIWAEADSTHHPIRNRFKAWGEAKRYHDSLRAEKVDRTTGNVVPFPLFPTKEEEQAFGPGIRGYFSLMRFFMFLWFICSIIVTPKIISVLVAQPHFWPSWFAALVGGQEGSLSQYWTLATTTLHIHLGDYPNAWVGLSWMTFLTDVVVFWTVLFSVNIFSRQLNRETARNSALTTDASDYTIEASHVGNKTNPADYRDHFSKYGPVARVIVIMSGIEDLSKWTDRARVHDEYLYQQMLSDERARRQGLNEVETAEMEERDAAKGRKLWRRALVYLGVLGKPPLLLKEQIAAIEKDLVDHASVEQRPVRVYVTYENKSGADACLRAYGRNVFVRLLAAWNPSVYFVVRANNPDTINWENLPTYWYSRWTRRMVVLLGLLLLLFVSSRHVFFRIESENFGAPLGQYGMCVPGSWFDTFGIDYSPNDRACWFNCGPLPVQVPVGNASSSVIPCDTWRGNALDPMAVATSLFMTERARNSSCLCLRDALPDSWTAGGLFGGGGEAGITSGYVGPYVLSGISVLVALIYKNSAAVSTDWEHHMHLSSQNRVVAMKLFFIYFVLYALLPNLLMELDTSSIDHRSTHHRDRSGLWTQLAIRVHDGAYLTRIHALALFTYTTILSDALWGNLDRVVATSHLIYKNLFGRTAMSVKRMKRYFVPPEYPFGQNTAVTGSIFFVTLWWGREFPVVYPLAFIWTFLAFAADRFTIMRVSRMPRAHNLKSIRTLLVIVRLGLAAQHLRSISQWASGGATHLAYAPFLVYTVYHFFSLFVVPIVWFQALVREGCRSGGQKQRRFGGVVEEEQVPYSEVYDKVGTYQPPVPKVLGRSMEFYFAWSSSREIEDFSAATTALMAKASDSDLL